MLSEDGAENFAPLMEVGCKGPVSVSLNVLSAGSKKCLQGRAFGSFSYECNNCGSSLLSKYDIPIKILLDFSNKSGVEWHDEEVEAFDDYLVTIGPEVQELEITNVIREQIILNYNPVMPGEGNWKVECKVCLSKPKQDKREGSKDEIDPRWEKLKLIKQNRNKD